jgi:antitoxin component of MazEF toxin-antitoxin module
MQVVKLRRIGNSTIVTLPPSMVEALRLYENDEMTIEVVGDRIMLTRATADFQDAWNAYQEIEPRYRNANLKLSK